jgi:hypothetical protein
VAVAQAGTARHDADQDHLLDEPAEEVVASARRRQAERCVNGNGSERAGQNRLRLRLRLRLRSRSSARR